MNNIYFATQILQFVCSVHKINVDNFKFLSTFTKLDLSESKTLILDVCLHTTTYNVNNGIAINFKQEYVRIILAIILILLYLYYYIIIFYM
jgi:hypothetical protein